MKRTEKIKNYFERLGYDMSESGISKKFKSIAGETFFAMIMGLILFYCSDKYGYDVVMDISGKIVIGLLIFILALGHLMLVGSILKFYKVKKLDEVFFVLFTSLPTIIAITIVYLLFKGYLAWWKYSKENQL